jgi:hypothetical protein
VAKNKNQLLSFQSILNGVMAGTSTLTSAVTDIRFLDDVGYQFVWTGTPVGTFSIQVSADYFQDINGNVVNPGNWISLILTYWNGAVFVTSSSIPTTVGSPIYIDLALLSAPWIRAQYTNISGAGVLTATITAKEI